MKDVADGDHDGAAFDGEKRVGISWSSTDISSDLNQHLADKTSDEDGLQNIGSHMSAHFRAGLNSGSMKGRLTALQADKDRLEHDLAGITHELDVSRGYYDVVTNEQVAPRHWLDRIFGAICLGLLTLVMAALPITVVTGLVQAEIEFVLDQPRWGVVFALGPILGIFATHFITDRLPNDHLKRNWELFLHFGTLGALAHWVWTFSGMAGLNNPDLTGISLINAQNVAVGEWLRAALILEVLGGGSLYCGAIEIGQRNNRRAMAQSEREEVLQADRQKLCKELTEIKKEVGSLEGELRRLEGEGAYRAQRNRDRFSAMAAEVNAAALQAAAVRRAELSSAKADLDH